MSFLNLSPSVLRWSTLAAWCVVVIAAGIMGSHQTWSDSMIRQMALGFHTRGTSPVIALELADSKEMIADLLPATEDGGKDRDTVVTLVEWDFLFILGYTALFLLMALRHRPSGTRTGLLILAAAVALGDVLENLQLLAALGRLPGWLAWISYMPSLLWWASSLKWMGTFTLVTCLGHMEITLPRPDILPSVLRCMTGGLMFFGGVTGLFWAFGAGHALLIENAFSFILAGLAILFLLFWMPDTPWKKEGA